MTTGRTLPEDPHFASGEACATTTKILAYFAVPAAIGLIFIARVFVLTDCFAFEQNDEVVHTFLEMKLAWKMMREGSLPLMNLYNNFGTPMIGDPVIYPFALHSLPYLMFSSPVAATINRFLMISLTISLLTFFLHKRFSLSLLVSSACAIVVVMLPNFNWFSVHHPHQGSVLYFVTVLIMQGRLRQKTTPLNLLGVYLSLLAFMLSVGLNGLVFALPYFILSQYIESRFRLDKSFVLFVTLMVAALLFLLPHFAYFFKILPLTARSTLSYGRLLPFTAGRLLTDVLFFRAQPALMHVSRSLYYSFPVIGLSLIGVFYVTRKHDLYSILLLGVAPLLSVMFLLVFVRFRESISFLKAVDLTRLLWFSNIYLIAGLGYALEAIRKARRPFHEAAAILVFLWLGFHTLCRYVLSHHGGKAQSLALVMCCLAVALILAIIRLEPGSPNAPKKSLNIMLFSLCFCFLPLVHDNLVASTRHFFNSAFEADFHPEQFLELMQPYSRVAARYEPTGRGHLSHAAKAGFFGSNGRSIVLHEGFRDNLLNSRLIAIGWHGMTYYFVSYNAEKLSRLGIKYVMTPKPSGFDSHGWTLKSFEPNEKCYLYENPTNVSLAYMISGSQIEFVHDIKYMNNEVHIDLGQTERDKECDLVLTFIRWPGWKVLIDGEPGSIQDSADYFLRAKVRPNNKSVIFYFEPFTTLDICACIAASIGIFAVSAIAVRRSRSSPLVS